MQYDKARCWRGIQASNPWWETGKLPDWQHYEVERDALPYIRKIYSEAEVGRGVVLLGPRRIGKTVILGQLVEGLLKDGVEPKAICVITLDDPTLRGIDLAELLEIVEARMPCEGPRWLLLDEVQQSPDWADWLKHLADSRRPYRFFATGSSATALRRGGRDAGLGRWRELTLFPWSFSEHVRLRREDLPVTWYFQVSERHHRGEDLESIYRDLGRQPPVGEVERLAAAFADYYQRGGFPEVAQSLDLREAQRRLREDIFYRSLGRDISDVESVETRLLERLFLLVCNNPGGLWNEARVAKNLQRSRQMINRYMDILENAFLIFRVPNLASKVRGQNKVYLVAPALRSALLHLNETDLDVPEEWGRFAENAVASTLYGGRSEGRAPGFWRKGNKECDFVVRHPTHDEFIEVKRGGAAGKPLGGIHAAAEALGSNAEDGVNANGESVPPSNKAYVLTHSEIGRLAEYDQGPLRDVWHSPVALWLYWEQQHRDATLARR